MRHAVVIFIILFHFCIDSESIIPKLETLFYSQDWHHFQPYLSVENKVRVNLTPILNEKGSLSRAQVLYCLKKMFARFDIQEIHQSDLRSDTNYSQIEMTVHFKMKNRTDERIITGTFLIMFDFREGKPVLSRWTITDILI